MNRIDWDWYGTWVIDWLCCTDPWESYDIWERAYLAVNPELLETREESYINGEGDGLGTTLDLIENHYHQSLIPLEKSFVYVIFRSIHWPLKSIHSLIWDYHSLFRSGKLRHQI
jgi:hypothetical protein